MSQTKVRHSRTGVILGLILLLVTALIVANFAMYSDVLKKGEAIATLSAPKTQSELNTAVDNYCGKYGNLADWDWDWKWEKDPNPTAGKIAPAVCYLNTGKVKIWVNLDTLEVTPRK